MSRFATAFTTAAVRQTIIDLAVMGVIGLVLALLGPFGTFSAPFALRLVFWLGLGWMGYACYRPIAGIARRLGTRLSLPEPPLWIAACLIATAPMTAMVLIVEQLPGPLHWPQLSGVITMYGYVLAIGSAVTLLFYGLRDRSLAPLPMPDGSPVQEAPQPAIRFLERIPPARSEDLIALEMEDHYLRVHTRHGSQLILLRMRDAVAELEGIAGEQVHRSWWVARHALATVKRDGRNLRLQLDGGLEAPVARDAVARLKSAGWF